MQDRKGSSHFNEIVIVSFVAKSLKCSKGDADKVGLLLPSRLSIRSLGDPIEMLQLWPDASKSSSMRIRNAGRCFVREHGRKGLT